MTTANSSTTTLDAVPPVQTIAPKVRVMDFSAPYNVTSVLQEITIDVLPRQRLAIIGPASSDKSTVLLSLIRLSDLEHHYSHTGTIRVGGQDIYSRQMDVAALGRRVGMVYA